MTETFTPPVVYALWDLVVAFMAGVVLGIVACVSAFAIADERR